MPQLQVSPPAAGDETAPVFPPDTPLLEPVTELPATPAPHLEAITLFPNQGDLSSGPGFNDQRFGYVLHGSVRATYESNIFISPRDEVEDFIFEISPAIAVGWGDFKGEVMGTSKFGDLFDRYLGKSYIFIDYRPSWTMFLDNSEQDSFDHDASLAGEWTLKKLSLGLRARYRTENRPDEDIGTREEQTRISAAFTSQYDFSGKTSFEINGSVETRAYENRGDDSQHWRNENWFNYQLRPKVSVSFGTTFGVIERSSGTTETFQQVLLRLRYKMTQNLSFGVSGGPQMRQNDAAGDSLDSVFSLSLAWTPSVDTYLSIQGFRRTVPSGARGQNYLGTGVNVTYRKLLFRHFYFGLAGGYRHAEYDGITSGPDFGREDDLFYIRPSLGFVLNEWLNCEVGGEFRSNDSTNQGRSFDATTLAVQLNVLF